MVNYRLTLSSVPLHRIIMFDKNGVHLFSDVPVNVWQGDKDVWKLLWKPNNFRRFFRWFLVTCHWSANESWNNKEAEVQRRTQNQNHIYWFCFCQAEDRWRIARAKSCALSTALSLNTLFIPLSVRTPPWFSLWLFPLSSVPAQLFFSASPPSTYDDYAYVFVCVRLCVSANTWCALSGP